MMDEVQNLLINAHQGIEEWLEYRVTYLIGNLSQHLWSFNIIKAADLLEKCSVTRPIA